MRIEDITKRAMPQISDCKLWDVRESLQSDIAWHALYCLLYLNTFTAIVDLSRSNFSIARAPLFQLKSAT